LHGCYDTRRFWGDTRYVVRFRLPLITREFLKRDVSTAQLRIKNL